MREAIPSYQLSMISFSVYETMIFYFMSYAHLKLWEKTYRELVVVAFILKQKHLFLNNIITYNYKTMTCDFLEFCFVPVLFCMDSSLKGPVSITSTIRPMTSWQGTCVPNRLVLITGITVFCCCWACDSETCI